MILCVYAHLNIYVLHVTLAHFRNFGVCDDIAPGLRLPLDSDLSSKCSSGDYDQGSAVSLRLGDEGGEEPGRTMALPSGRPHCKRLWGRRWGLARAATEQFWGTAADAGALQLQWHHHRSESKGSCGRRLVWEEVFRANVLDAESSPCMAAFWQCALLCGRCK